MEYHVDDRALEAEEFLGFASRVWPGDYDVEKTRETPLVAASPWDTTAS